MGSVLGRLHRLLLSYPRCLGSATWEGGVASWVWGAAGLQSSKGPVSPRVRWGGSGWTEASGLGEWSRLEMMLESSPGKRPGGSKWVTAKPMQVMMVFERNSEPEGLALRGPASFSCSFVKHSVRV